MKKCMDRLCCCNTKMEMFFLSVHVDLPRLEVRLCNLTHPGNSCTASRGAVRARCSQLASRAHMIMCSSWPAMRRQEDLKLLQTCHVEQGFPFLKVEKLLRKIRFFKPECHSVGLVNMFIGLFTLICMVWSDEQGLMGVRCLHFCDANCVLLL